MAYTVKAGVQLVCRRYLDDAFWSSLVEAVECGVQVDLFRGGMIDGEL